jgi:lipopolysaccharide export system protein LptA
MTRRSGLAFLLALTLAGPAAAQLSPDGGPIQIEAGTAEILDQSKRVVYTSNVDVVQGNARLQSDVLTVNFAGSETSNAGGIGGGFGAISNMTAEGNVHYVTDELKARGDNAVYTASNDTVFMTGNVILARGEDIATGECLTLQISEGRSTLGCDGAASGNGTGRVRIQINPTEREN